MRNIINLLVKYNAFIIFLILEVGCLILLIRHNNFQWVNYINSANFISGNVNSTYTSSKEYLRLRTINDSIAEENAKLRSLLKYSLYNDGINIKALYDSAFRQHYTYIDAKVISSSTNKGNNYILINKGTRHGIRAKMGVISANGIVGHVKDASQNFSTIMSVLHSKVKVGAKLQRENYSGLVSWNRKDPHIVILENIPKHVKIIKGDSVVTSGNSAFFPENIMIGTVYSFQKTSGNFYDIEVLLSTNFENISYVYVVNNLMREEQIKLEEIIKNEQVNN